MGLRGRQLQIRALISHKTWPIKSVWPPRVKWASCLGSDLLLTRHLGDQDIAWRQKSPKLFQASVLLWKVYSFWLLATVYSAYCPRATFSQLNLHDNEISCTVDYNASFRLYVLIPQTIHPAVHCRIIIQDIEALWYMIKRLIVISLIVLHRDIRGRGGIFVFFFQFMYQFHALVFHCMKLFSN